MGHLPEESAKRRHQSTYPVDLETSIPTFFHITEARVNDMNAMDVIPHEENSFYIFDRGYNDFERLFRINAIGAHFKKRKFIFFTNALDSMARP